MGADGALVDSQDGRDLHGGECLLGIPAEYVEYLSTQYHRIRPSTSLHGRGACGGRWSASGDGCRRDSVDIVGDLSGDGGSLGIELRQPLTQSRYFGSKGDHLIEVFCHSHTFQYVILTQFRDRMTDFLDRETNSYVIARDYYVIVRNFYVIARDFYVAVKNFYVIVRNLYFIARNFYVTVRNFYVTVKNFYVIVRNFYVTVRNSYVIAKDFYVIATTR